MITFATPIDEHSIRLEWTHSNPSGHAMRFEIIRVPAGPGPPPAPDQQSPFLHQQLDAGESYSYRVQAIRVIDDEDSEFSAVATAVTFAEAFSADLVGAGTNVDVSNDCIVQRLNPPSLAHRGNLVRITVQAGIRTEVTPGGSDADLKLTRVTISDADPAGDLFDSAATPTEVGGPFPLISQGTSFALPDTRFDVETFRSILIAFDVQSPGGTRFAPKEFCQPFTKDGTPGQPVTDAATADRLDFVDGPTNQVWLI